MSDSKDKRINKLKRKRIWPSILGLFIIVLFFSGILVTQLVFNASEIVQRKVFEGISLTETIATVFESYEGEDEKRIQDAVSMHVEMLPQIEAVWVSDLNGEKVWANSDMEPNLENEIEIIYSDKESLSLILEVAGSQGVTNRGNTIVFDEEFFKKLDIPAIIKSGFSMEHYINNQKEIIQLKAWYLQEVDDLKVYVLQDVSVYEHDFFVIVISTVLFGLIIAVFILYYLSSFIVFIISMNKTTKVIYTDMVTGGNNWLYFVKKGNQLLKKKSAASDYAVIYFKMRKYRSFCTCFGVREGEVLIERLYTALKKYVNRNEVMAYKQNSEFGLLLAYTNEQQLCARIEGMFSALDAVLPRMKLYFVAGVYKVQRQDRDIEQLFNHAVLACDMLGEEAENRIVFFDVEMNKRRLWERKVEDDMDAALARHEFQVYLQPKISTAQEVLSGAEALVRWIHPQEGFIPPNKFIPIFERNGFILKLDDYMLEEISKQQALWIRQGRKVVPISVNVSRAHFAKEDLAEHICSIVDKYHVPHNVIELELTESAFFDDKEVLLQTVKKLRDAGFVVSMDDFGAGYSSLNSLKELQLDVLKLDADFFRGAEAADRGMLIVSEVIDLAKKLNMKIVAEGIETKEQVEFLTEQECDLIQGYFFAKPMPISEFEEKYKETL